MLTKIRKKMKITITITFFHENKIGKEINNNEESVVTRSLSLLGFNDNDDGEDLKLTEPEGNPKNTNHSYQHSLLQNISSFIEDIT